MFKASRSARICTVLVLAAIVSCESRHEPPAEPSSIDLYPAISPDGEWVVYTRYGPALQPGFYRTRIGSAGAELLIADWVEADWNPDGRTLVLAMGQQIYRYDLATAELAPLTTVGLNLAPAWSPDGQTIAFATNAGDGTHPPDLWLMQGDASAPRRVPLPGPPRDELSHVDWAPSGDRLVGPSFRGLFITDTLGRDTLYLRTASTFQADPAWSPTGEWIAYSTADQTYGDIWLVRPDGTQNHRLIPRAGQPAWFPDGQRLAVVRPGPEAQTIWAVDLDGQLLQELTSSAE